MATNTKQVKPLDIPFKEFMPGQLIQSAQFNDDMKDIEDKVNETIGEQNTLANEVNAHTDNYMNPHRVDAHQTGTYDSVEIDEFVTDLKDGNFNDNVIDNRVLADDCVDTRNLQDNSVTNSKLDGSVGSQINITQNISIKDRYTKEEVDTIVTEKVGNGTYDKETIDSKLEQIQAGQIVENTIGVEKLKTDVGTKLDISKNENIKNKYTKEEVNLLIEENGLPKDWGDLMVNAKQVKLRGGTMNEHKTFVGANKEITVDTTMKTIRVHDGVTAGGKVLATFHDVVEVREDIGEEIKQIKDDMGKSHDHNDKYAQIVHGHSQYPVKPNSCIGVFSKVIHGHHGLTDENGSDDGWYRTCRNGFLPYQPGGYSNLGADGWRFDRGWFNHIDSKRIIVAKDGHTSSIDFPAQTNDPGFIRHIENNNSSGMYFSVSDDVCSTDRFYFGASPEGHFQSTASINSDGDMWLKGWLSTDFPHMLIGGRRVYFDGQRPWDAPEGSISFG